MKNQASKKRITVILSLALVGLVAIGITLATLTSMTQEYDNAFTFAENIKARLDEPNWDPPDDMIPGMEIWKDPIVTNISNNGVNEFTAIRLNFTDGDKNLLSDTVTDTDCVGRLLRLIDIDWNTADWELIDSSYEDKAEQIWIYKHELAPGEPTTPLFHSVTIKSSLTTAELAQAPVATDWETEFAWLASMVMNHDEDCYEYGAHDASCTITYNHHKNCAIAGESAASGTPAGGTVNGKTCDCVPVTVHEAECPAMIGTVKAGCGHTGAGIDGFHIVVVAAVVQSGVDGMDDYSDTATKDALTALFTASPYTP